MTVVLALGWWVLPALITAAAGLWALWPEAPSYGDYNFGGVFMSLLKLCAAVIATLVAWLVYFIAF